MKLISVTSHISDGEVDAYRQLVASLGLPQEAIVDPPDGHFHVQLEDQDPRLEGLRSGLGAKGFSWFERVDEIYSDDELAAFPLLCLIVPQQVEAALGEEGTRHDRTRGCPRCGTGAPQIAPLFVKRSLLPREAILCRVLRGQIVIAEDAAQALAEVGARGVQFGPVEDQSGHPVPWRQIMPDVTLPPMSRTSEWILTEDQCPHCRRDGFFHSRKHSAKIVYEGRGVSPDAVGDFAQTWECFGNTKRTIAQPKILVRPRTFRHLRDLGIASKQFLPVRIE